MKNNPIIRFFWTLSLQGIYLYLAFFLKKDDFSRITLMEIQEGYGKGLKMYIPNAYSSHYQNIIKGSYEIFLMKGVLEIMDLKGKIIWDIGAHHGYHSLVFSMLAGLDGRVVTFEPNPNNILAMERNFAENEWSTKNIELNNLAIGKSNGIQNFKISKNIYEPSTSGGFLTSVVPPESEGAYKNFKEIEVKVLNIDTLINEMGFQAPNFVKIDVEGAELDVLLGSKVLIQLHRPIFVIEIHSITLMFRIHEFFIEHNYSLRILDENESFFTKNIIAIPVS